MGLRPEDLKGQVQSRRKPKAGGGLKTQGQGKIMVRARLMARDMRALRLKRLRLKSLKRIRLRMVEDSSRASGGEAGLNTGKPPALQRA